MNVFEGIRDLMDFFDNANQDPYFKDKLPAKLRELSYYIKQIECKELVSILQRRIFGCMLNATK